MKSCRFWRLSLIASRPLDDRIPAQREKLVVLVSTGKSKEAIGVQLSHDQIKRLSDKDVLKYFIRYEAYAGNKTTESLIDSAIMLFSKGAGLVVLIVLIDDVKELQKELKNDCHHLLGVLHFDAVDGWR